MTIPPPPPPPPPYAPQPSAPSLYDTHVPSNDSNRSSGRGSSFDMGLIRQHEDDEALARRLQAEEDQAAYLARSQLNVDNHGNGRGSMGHTSAVSAVSGTSASASGSSSVSRNQHQNQNRSGRRITSTSQITSASRIRPADPSSHANFDFSASESFSRERPIRVQIPYQYPTTPTAVPTRQFFPSTDPRNHHHPATTSAAAARTAKTDEEIAKDLQQEMRDEEIARALQAKEEERILRMAAQNQQRRSGSSRGNLRQTAPGSGTGAGSYGGVQRRPCCHPKRLCSAGFMLMIVATGAFLIATYGSTVWQKLGGDPNDLPPFFHDTWGGGPNSNYTAGEFSEWKNKKNGLQLKIQNALTPDWDDYFVEAVKDWNEAPALLLTTERSTADPKCSSIRGIMKVCNDDYGKTGWTGLNEVHFEGNNISKSVAKMNEYYLKTARNAEKQFVMCHEIGHGFGLPHRDENVNNADLGSCLDYTYRFENNMKPDVVVDFDNLETMYGRVPGSRRYLASIYPTLRNRHESTEKRELDVEETQFQKANWHFREGRLLHQSKHREVYENHLGDDRRVVTTILLPQD